MGIQTSAYHFLYCYRVFRPVYPLGNFSSFFFFLLFLFLMFLQAIHEYRESAYSLLVNWDIPPSYVAVGLLGSDTLDPVVRRLACHSLSMCSDVEFSSLLPVMCAGLMYECHHFNDLARLLFERTCRAPSTLGNTLFWNIF